MSLADSLGVIGPDCKHGVNNPSTNLLTHHINGLFTVRRVRNQKNADPIAEFALALGEKKHGSIAGFSVALFGEDKRQQVGQWLWRGIPHNQRVKVAKELGMTVEQLLDAGKAPIPEPPLPPEAVAFAKEWLELPLLVRTQIQALVRSLPKEMGRIDGETVERPELQRRRGVKAAV